MRGFCLSQPLFGQDQLVVAGVAQAIGFVAVADQQFAAPLQQALAVDGTAAGAATGAAGCMEGSEMRGRCWTITDMAALLWRSALMIMILII